ncbi:MAG: PQQ-dependent sugar dehydrogenase [Verrucomicrobiota bacterium]
MEPKSPGKAPLAFLRLLVGALLLAPLHAARIENDTLALPASLPTGAYDFEHIDWFESAMVIKTPADQSNQLYIAERPGTIVLISDVENWIREPDPFLDISNRVTENGENGLLGLAFHPNYRTNGYFYLFYTRIESNTRYNRVSRFTRSSQDSKLADPNSELVLIDQVDQASNHNGGDMHFGPDGYLYISLGDEGGGNDSYDNGQRIDRDFFAGIIRLDVDKTSGIEPTDHPAVVTDENGARYTIPTNNPLVASWQSDGSDPESDLRLEFYAIGLRNPWRMSFDPVTGKLWVADVGQVRREEVDIIENGGNYGWPNREGALAGPKSPAIPDQFQTLSNPILEYPRSDGASITGGIVYRGTNLPELEGAYVFGDYVSGNTWFAYEPEPGQLASKTYIGNVHNQAAYGRDPNNGDVLISRLNGSLVRLVRGEEASEPSFPSTLSATGAFSNLATLTPQIGILPYDINLPFWSDHAIKSRWVYIPYDQKIGYSENDPWDFPEGSVWIKHFDLETERGNPNTRTRVETRFIVKTAESIYGLSYRWNEAQTEATLVADEGETIEYQVTVDGIPQTQTWQIPSRQQCLQCHTAKGGYALSFNVRQLNKTQNIEANEQNLLAYLNQEGYFETDIGDTVSLPRHYAISDESVTLQTRARSYLSANCIACHQQGGSAPFTWDARPHIDIEETNLFGGQANNDGGSASRRLAIRGNPGDSIILSRIAATHGFTRMPPLATNERDTEAIQLITEWLNIPMPSNLSYEDWVLEFFGSNEVPDSLRSDDPDRDGSTNLQEFLNRTHPLDPQRIQKPDISSNSNDINLSLTLSPNRNYKIESSSDLQNWQDWDPAQAQLPESDPVEETQATINAPAPANGETIYLRVQVSEKE